MPIVLGVIAALGLARVAQSSTLDAEAPHLLEEAPLTAHAAPVPWDFPLYPALIPLELATAERDRPAFPLSRLPPLHIVNVNTRESATLRLYNYAGDIDASAGARLDELLADARDPENVRVTTFNRRTLQLLFKAAYHFGSYDVTIISGYRAPGRGRWAEGMHAFGNAVDFRLAKVSAAALAAYLRTQPRVGVGVYPHPDTQYVHLDSRPQSYYWIDASGPGRRGRERSMGGGRSLMQRDAAYDPIVDWPEGTMPLRPQLLWAEAPDTLEASPPSEPPHVAPPSMPWDEALWSSEEGQTPAIGG